MDDFILTLTDINTKCRICLTESELMKNLFDIDKENEISIAETLEASMNIKVEHNEKLPSLICEMCEIQIYSFVDFKNKFEYTQNILHEYLKDRQSENKEKFNVNELSVAILEDLRLDQIELVEENDDIHDDSKLLLSAEEVKEKIISVQEQSSFLSNKTCHIFEKDTLKKPLDKHREKSRDFMCKMCPRSFIYYYTLKRHMVTHNSAHKYTCDLCCRNFVRKDHLKRHIKNIHNTSRKGNIEDPNRYRRVLSCDICWKTFAIQKSLDMHKLTHTEEGLICGTCGKLYPTESKLQQHVNGVHRLKNSKPNYLCYICAKGFKKEHSLKQHISIHLGIAKRHICKVCNKTFAQGASLALHMNIHTGSKPYICEICSAAFNRPGNLNRHKRFHDNIRPYCCQVCEKSFSVKNSLIIHLRTHTGEKPLQCLECSKTFSDPSSLTKHRRICTAVVKAKNRIVIQADEIL